MLKSENLPILRGIDLNDSEHSADNSTLLNSYSSDDRSSQEDFDISECTQVLNKRIKVDKSNAAHAMLKLIHDKHTDAQSTLKPPVVIEHTPPVMENDARELHMSIDPYELLRNKYEIHGRTSTLTTECEMMAFLRCFLDESNFSRNILDLTLKLKERLKYEYPRFYVNDRKVFKLKFVKLESV